jgi:hypothetical protein
MKPVFERAKKHQRRLFFQKVLVYRSRASVETDNDKRFDRPPVGPKFADRNPGGALTGKTINTGADRWKGDTFKVQAGSDLQRLAVTRGQQPVFIGPTLPPRQTGPTV